MRPRGGMRRWSRMSDDREGRNNITASLCGVSRRSGMLARVRDCRGAGWRLVFALPLIVVGLSGCRPSPEGLPCTSQDPLVLAEKLDLAVGEMTCEGLLNEAESIVAVRARLSQKEDVIRCEIVYRLKGGVDEIPPITLIPEEGSLRYIGDFRAKEIQATIEDLKGKEAKEWATSIAKGNECHAVYVSAIVGIAGMGVRGRFLYIEPYWYVLVPVDCGRELHIPWGGVLNDRLWSGSAEGFVWRVLERRWAIESKEAFGSIPDRKEGHH
ncbi:MAG: hypothetical protein BIFFINMI_02810 [Phycisphaerae bacterium]|nr:hypothetical protein [Phycisphaerae bacterium]